MEGVSTKQPARMTLPRPPAGSGGFASWSFHCAYWGAYIIFVGLFALRVAPTPGRCYRAPPLRLPLIPDNFGGRIYRRTIILCFFRPRERLFPSLTRSWTRVTGRANVFSTAIPLPSFRSNPERERERERDSFPSFLRSSIGPGDDKTGGGRGERSLSRVSHEARPRLMGTQFVAAAAYRRVYEAAALFRFYFGKNLAAYVTARIYARRAVGSSSVRPSFVSRLSLLPHAPFRSISLPISLLLLLLSSCIVSTRGGRCERGLMGAQVRRALTAVDKHKHRQTSSR